MQAGNVKQLHLKKLDTGAEIVLEADLVLLAMGFTGPVRSGLIDEIGVKLDATGEYRSRGLRNVSTRNFRGGGCAERAVVGSVGDRGGPEGGGGGGEVFGIVSLCVSVES